MTKPHWLEITESVALAGSVQGAIAVAGTQQVLYAVVPLTVSVSSHLANRQGLYPLNQRRSEAAIAQGLEHLDLTPKPSPLPELQTLSSSPPEDSNANQPTPENPRELPRVPWEDPKETLQVKLLTPPPAQNVPLIMRWWCGL